MRSLVLLLVFHLGLLSLPWAGVPCAALAAEPTPLETAPPPPAYLEAIEGRGIEAEVRYYPHDGPAPAFEVDAPAPEPARDEAGEVAGWPLPQEITLLVLAAILGGVLYLAIRGGAPSVSMRRAPDPGRRPAAAATPAPAASDPVATDLDRLAADPDRERALVALAGAALARAAAAQGLRLGRSWTARDALRRVPAQWPHRPALARLVRAAELTRFGGRPVSEAAFRDHLAEARPIFAETPEPAR